VNGLVEVENRILLGQLRRACASENGDQGDANRHDWPEVLDAAVSDINDCGRSVSGYSGRQLMYALASKPAKFSTTEKVDLDDVNAQLAFAEDLKWNPVAQSLETQGRRKARYDRRVSSSELKVDQLVMTLSPKFSEDTHSTKGKLRAKWLGPRRITVILGTSCRVETLQGIPIAGRFNLNRVRRVVFAPSPAESRDLRRAEAETSQ
jgi:hypothetical protein